MHKDFDHSAKNYLVSSDHKTGEDLEYLIYHLDIIAAADHFTKVFKSYFIFGLDTTHNILPLRGRSEYLQFKDNTFDLVTLQNCHAPF